MLDQPELILAQMAVGDGVKFLLKLPEGKGIGFDCVRGQVFGFQIILKLFIHGNASSYNKFVSKKNSLQTYSFLV